MNNNLYEALFKVTKKLESVKKSSDNPFFKSKYADLNTHLDLVKPLLEENGLMLLQPTVSVDGKTMVTTRLVHVETGEMIESSIAIPDSISDSQKIGAAITYFRRFGINSLFALKSEDDDGETVAGRGKSPKTEKSVPTTVTTKASFGSSIPSASEFNASKGKAF